MPKVLNNSYHLALSYESIDVGFLPPDTAETELAINQQNTENLQKQQSSTLPPSVVAPTHKERCTSELTNPLSLSSNILNTILFADLKKGDEAMESEDWGRGSSLGTFSFDGSLGDSSLSQLMESLEIHTPEEHRSLHPTDESSEMERSAAAIAALTSYQSRVNHPLDEAEVVFDVSISKESDRESLKKRTAPSHRENKTQMTRFSSGKTLAGHALKSKLQQTVPIASLAKQTIGSPQQQQFQTTSSQSKNDDRM